MDPQNSYPIFSGGSQPPTIPSEIGDLLHSSSGTKLVSYYGGTPMVVSISNGSTDSIFSRGSNSSATTASTFSTTYGSYDKQTYMAHSDSNHSPAESGYMEGDCSDDLQPMYNNGNTFFPQNSGRAGKQTPSSLQWTPATIYLGLYKFVVPKGKHPYLELLPGCDVHEGITPQIVYLDEPIYLKGVYPCQFPGLCLGKRGEPSSFSRPADLERHYIHVHAESESKAKFPCDYRKCTRAKDPFTRKDHYRDHLRDYHKEDLGCAKRCVKSQKESKGKISRDNAREEAKWQEDQAKWVDERRINPENWRCAKCLQKIIVAENGWECPICHLGCEQDRITTRQKRATEIYSHCSTCNGTAWIEDMHSANGWGSCPNCTTSDLVQYDGTWNFDDDDLDMK